MKILLAVDGSKYTKKMLAYLTVHAELFSAVSDFTVFTAQAPLPPRAPSVSMIRETDSRGGGCGEAAGDDRDSYRSD